MPGRIIGVSVDAENNRDSSHGIAEQGNSISKEKKHINIVKKTAKSAG